ncbi:MAG: hypothetical protein KKC46_11175 [Proteobacteria bacterium]|nr:hypothetical protein [Pseudomonadota bacterium]
MKTVKKAKPVKKPAVKKAAAKKPAVKKAAAKKPAVKKAVAKKPAVKKAVAKKPAVKKTAVKTVKAIVAKKPSNPQVTILGSVLTTVKRSKNGIAIAKIKEKTGLEQRQLSNALYKLLKNGKVALKERGVYIAAS